MVCVDGWMAGALRPRSWILWLFLQGRWVLCLLVSQSIHTFLNTYWPSYPNPPSHTYSKQRRQPLAARAPLYHSRVEAWTWHISNRWKRRSRFALVLKLRNVHHGNCLDIFPILCHDLANALPIDCYQRQSSRARFDRLFWWCEGRELALGPTKTSWLEQRGFTWFI